MASTVSTTVTEVCWLTQVHGAHVVTVGPLPTAVDEQVGRPVVARQMGEGDALVAASGDVALVVLVADCAPLALASDEGVFAAVHAGWRGLEAGVVEATIDEMRAMGATRVVGALGPSIHAECYEFTPADLDPLVARYAGAVKGHTSAGRPSLDLPAAVSAALAASDAVEVPGVSECTACSDRWFSHRRRGDQGRQALVVWRDAGRSIR